MCELVAEIRFPIFNLVFFTFYPARTTAICAIASKNKIIVSLFRQVSFSVVVQFLFLHSSVQSCMILIDSTAIEEYLFHN